MQPISCLQTKSGTTVLHKQHSNLNLPNFLTFFRICLIPIYIALFSAQSSTRSLVAAIVFGIAALTDLLDGYLARRHSQVTTLGKILDPVADKLLVAAGLILLVQYQRIDSWLAFAIIAREIGVTGLRSIAASEGIVIAADNLGKSKTFFQVIGILLLTLPISTNLFAFDLHLLGMVLLYLALLLGVLSGIRYLTSVLHKIGARDGLLRGSS